MTAVVASWPAPSDRIVVTLDVRPGGLHAGDGSRPLICLCLTPGCSCSRHLSGGA